MKMELHPATEVFRKRESETTMPILPAASITIDPVDTRWQRYTALAKGNVVSNIRAAPSTNAVIADVLEVGITTKLWHMPLDTLTDVEKVYSFDGQFRWWIVKLVDRIGYIREDVVTLKPAPDETPEPPPAPVPTPTENAPSTPPLPVEPQPTSPPDVVTLPKSMALAIREMLAEKIIRLEDAERGLHQERMRLAELKATLDKVLDALPEAA